MSTETVPLYAVGRHAPVSTINIAESSAKRVSNGQYSFGVDRANLVKSIRALADAIETGSALVQDVLHYTRAPNDDSVKHWVTVQFSVRRPQE